MFNTHILSLILLLFSFGTGVKEFKYQEGCRSTTVYNTQAAHSLSTKPRYLER